MICKIFLLACITLNSYSYAQSDLKGTVIDAHSREAILGVNIIIQGTNIGTATDINGTFNLRNVPTGKQIIRFSHIGYKEYEIEMEIPYNGDNLEIGLESELEEIEEVFVNATRSSRTIDAEPTRVEVIAGEEIDEKISMDPSNISMMLNESTGIQVQQTSAASANNTFRIQGLDGRYTQLLRDGYPLFGGYSGSLSIVQIPPLDLKQIEIIKGSTSTLYGGGAIAGLINLISKQPSKVREISFLVNATSALGMDLSGFYSGRFDTYGITILASRNTQKVYDNNNDRFSDLPQIERYTLNPKFYIFFDESKTLEIGGSISTEERIGGFLGAIENEGDLKDFYHERNNSNRFTMQIQYNCFGKENFFTIKNSVSYFGRELSLIDYSFEGNQFSSFSEAVYRFNSGLSEWLFGINLYTENFEELSEASQKRSNSDVTYGSFLQLTSDLIGNISIESGLRVDYNNDYGFSPLPRLNLLVNWNDEISSRIGGGLGYKIPTIFIERSEELAFRNILPIDKENTKAEKSYGFNFDIDYKTILFGEITLSINNLFFYTRINDPLYLRFDNSFNYYEYKNFNGYFDTKGIETNLKLTYDNYKLFAGYTYTDVKSYSGEESSSFPLTPQHRLGLVLIYEIHGNLRIGLEAYYTGRQRLFDGTLTTDYWINGLMIEKRFNNFSLFLNFENFLDTRQSKYGPMFTGLPDDPKFVEIYAPTDGRIINGGIKLNL